MEKFLYYFLLFFIYSVIGFFCECSYCSIKDKKIVLNRGFLIGPYLPIYGYGALAIILFLDKYKNDFVALFIMTCIVASLLEYITSYIMEKVFKARWWDYTDKKFDINGRICLENSFYFGLGGIVITYIVNPVIQVFINNLNYYLFLIISVLFFIVYTVDTLISVQTIYKLRTSSININRDETNEFKTQVIMKLSKNRYFKKRLLNAFPNVNNLTVYKSIKEIVNNKITK